MVEKRYPPPPPTAGRTFCKEPSASSPDRLFLGGWKRNDADRSWRRVLAINASKSEHLRGRITIYTCVATAATAVPLPLVCGPYRVPFLLNLPGDGQRFRGELYSVTARGLARLDELEGVSRAHYERLPVSVVVEGGQEAATEGAVAYYAHRGYAAEMWARSGHAEYSPAVAAGYVRRVDRPQHLTFLDQIRVFVSSQS